MIKACALLAASRVAINFMKADVNVNEVDEFNNNYIGEYVCIRGGNFLEWYYINNV